MAWLSSRAFALRCAGQRLARRPWASLATLLLAALAIALPLAIATLALALQPIGAQRGAPTQAVVFLKAGASAADVASVTATAAAQPGVSGAMHVPRDEALAVLARLAPRGALPDVKANPLPDAIVVRFAARSRPAQAQAAVDALSQTPRVDAVQFDAERHRRWHAATDVAVLIAAGLGLVTLGVAFGLVLIAPRALAPLDPNEREVLLLVGAAPGFTHRPAAYAGALLGAGSAVAGIGLVAAALAALAPSLAELRSAWQSDIAWALPALPALASLTAAAAVAGWLGGRTLR